MNKTIEQGYTVTQPPHGFVRYINHLGTDTTIAEAARVSYGQGSKGEELDKKLIRYLFINRHTSPFEQCNITFNIRLPIFVMRQLVRHRTLRLNEFSARYKELPDQFFLPMAWRKPAKDNKQGSVAPQPHEVDDYIKWNEENDAIAREAFSRAHEAYMDLIKRGIANELARIVIPTAVYTEIYVNVDLHNLMHLLYLRLDSHAQQEIRDVAAGMCHMAQNLFPWTFELFCEFELKMVTRP